MLNLAVKAPVAERANLAHREIGKRDFGSIKRMIALGKMLDVQKRQLPHGEWLPWIRNNLEFSAQTAERYIRLYRNRDKVMEAQPDTLAKALEAIGDRGKTRQTSDKDPLRPLIGDIKLARQRTIAPIKAVRRALANLTLSEGQAEAELKNDCRDEVLKLLQRLPSYDGVQFFCKFQFGQRLRDRVTGFTGIFTGLAQDLSGQQCCWLTPPIDNDGSYVNEQLFSAATLEVVDEGILREISM